MKKPVTSDFVSLLHWILQGSKQNHCPNCGTTIDNIIKTSRLGCAYCYEFFKDELLPVFKKVHNSIEHKGKTPQVTDKVTILEQKLKYLIECEKYEEAAKVKKQLDKLKS